MRPILSLLLLAIVAVPAVAEPKSDARLDELHVPAGARQQSDLETVRLASAHRERAESIEQKTTGLWQSWLVSICEGCNPRQRRPAEIDAAADAYVPAYKMSATDQPKAAPGNDPGSLQKSSVRETGLPLYTDLSSSNLSQIRKMPSR